VVTAAARWAEALAAWAIPESILATAPESPWGFPSDVFLDVARAALEEPHTPTHRRAVDALPEGGVVLDVGSGAGAASVPIAPPARRIVAVDEDAAMLRALAELAAGRAEVELVHGRWPDVAGDVAPVDVAVCANVAYNVAALDTFVAALTRAARHRVVLELSANHPQQPLSPLWHHFWGLSRPDTPTADDAARVVVETTGSAVEVERWSRTRSFMGEQGAETIAWIRRRLCLPAEADAEVAEQLDRLGELAPSAMVTLWWPGEA
jgi:SAM-dependent methyltransferase